MASAPSVPAGQALAAAALPPLPPDRQRGRRPLALGLAGAALALTLVSLREAVGPPERTRGGGAGAALRRRPRAAQVTPCAFAGGACAGRPSRLRHPDAAGRRAWRGDESLEIIGQEKEIAIAGAVQPLSWEAEKPRPPTLPLDIFKPKLSLSQNFLADPNYVFKMVTALKDRSPSGKRVLELGPGTGALTTRLFKKYPEMVGIELDQRAIRVLNQNVPGVTVVRSDVLLVNYTRLAEIRGGKLSIIGNLPYHVTSQILFKLLDHAASVNTAHVTMQKEVADRIVARPGTRQYSRPSVAFQLYCNPTKLFEIPPTAFFPRPNVHSAYLELDFKTAHERRLALGVNPRDLKNLTFRAFAERRKMLHNSLAPLLRCHHTLIDELPDNYGRLRPQQLEPWEFVHLTQLMFGKKEFPRYFRNAWRGEFGRTVKNKD